MIWHCLTKNDVIALYEEAEQPLDEEMLECLTVVEKQLVSEEVKSFVVIDSQCRICNYKQVCIAPEICDYDNLECGNCGQSTVQEREIPEWEDD